MATARHVLRALPPYTVDRVVVLVSILLLWEVAGRTVGGPLLPPFSATVVSLFTQSFGGGKLPGAFVASNMALGIGFSISLVVGIALGLLMGVSRVANQ